MTTMVLAQNKIHDEGAKAIAAALSTAPALTTVDLHWNSLTSEGAKAFAAVLPSSPSLIFLDVHWNSINGEGIQVLKQAWGQAGKRVVANYKQFINAAAGLHIGSQFDVK